jgi:hypothetical protein
MSDESARITVPDGGVVEISLQGLARVLAESRLLREEGTSLSGPIRVLARCEEVFFQEQIPQGKLLIRRMADLEFAERLLQDRLDACERMWDGFGCPIGYYS